MNSLETLLRQLTPFQRIYIVGAALASAAVLVLFVTFASKPDYQPAFTRLSSADAGAVSEALRSAKIDFQLADAGATVMVPASSLAAARIAASEAGFAPDAGAPGMELFNSSNFGMSEFDQRVTYQRAKEGELARTIKTLDGVGDARVTIVAAETGLLSQDDRPATASVVITMQDGGQPDRAMVRGIVSTVASSIAGLSPDDVTVVDNSGRVLAGPQVGGSSEALVAQDTVERSIAAKIQNLVDQAIGVGNSSIAVSATLDFTKVAEQITTYTPVNDQNYTPVSVHLSNEALGGAAGLGAGGIPGTASNIPGLPTYTLPGAAASAAPAAASPAPAASLAPGASPDPLASASAAPSAAAAAGYGSTDVTVNYNLSQKIENIVHEPGVLQRLSVAVLIDETAAAGIEPGKLQAAIEAAIGADLARGDVVSVTQVAFAVVEPESAPDTLAPIMEMLPGVLTTVLAVIIGLVLTLLLWRNMGALGRRAEEAALMAEMPRQAALAPGYSGESESVRNLLTAAPTNSAQAEIQDRLRIVADQKPDALVGLMNGWLQDEVAKR